MTDFETVIAIKNMARDAVKKATAKNGQLLGTSPSLEMMKKLLADFWYGDPATYSFTEIGPNKWAIHGPNGVKSGTYVIKKGGRYRFEME